jgi:hypothetical protein
MLDSARFRPAVVNWLQDNPEAADAARDDFESPDWFDQLVISVYPCPPSKKVMGILRSVAREALQAKSNVVTQFESRLNKKFALLEAIQDVNFVPDNVEGSLREIVYDDSGYGKATVRFKSRPLTDEDHVVKDAWFTPNEFNDDFPGEFDKAFARLRDTFARMQPVEIEYDSAIGSRTAVVDFKKANAEFGGASVDVDADGRQKVFIYIEVRVPLMEEAIPFEPEDLSELPDFEPSLELPPEEA